MCLAMAQCNLTIRAHVAWWVRWYLSGVAIVAHLTCMEPDMEKVRRTVMRGVRFEIAPDA